MNLVNTDTFKEQTWADKGYYRYKLGKFIEGKDLFEEMRLIPITPSLITGFATLIISALFTVVGGLSIAPAGNALGLYVSLANTGILITVISIAALGILGLIIAKDIITIAENEKRYEEDILEKIKYPQKEVKDLPQLTPEHLLKFGTDSDDPASTYRDEVMKGTHFQSLWLKLL